MRQAVRSFRIVNDFFFVSDQQYPTQFYQSRIILSHLKF